MKLLRDILYKVPLLDSIGSTNVAITNITFDSRQVVKETLFVAFKGTSADGHAYIETAIKSGARAIICENLPFERHEEVTYIQVKNSQQALGIIASNFYDNPSEKLQLIAVTGTNGKTTIASLLYRLFTDFGYKAGLLSTVEVKIANERFEATHTTPDPVQLNRHLKKMVEAGCRYCFMEASSHGIVQHRMAGLDVNGALFSNISRDHLDYHGSFDEYILAKKKLFDDLPKTAFALINIDDKHGINMLYHTKAKKYTYAMKSEADFKVKILEQRLDGTLLRIGHQEIWTKLIGDFNAYNLLAIYATAILLKMDELQIATTISNLKPVDGRFQYVPSASGITTIVDYAHTPDALKNVLQTIIRLRGGHEQLITVVGCGGNRDKGKRPQMARIATEFSTQTIFTSDNPRNEEPETIIEEMEAGVEAHRTNSYLSISNRKEAIKTAIKLAAKGDIILIAGKGHEKYQEIKGEKHPFDDFAIASEYLNQKTP